MLKKMLLNGGNGMTLVSNRGYLNEDYRLFHSTDRRDVDFQTHSHDFHKLVLCLTGSVTYIVEGVTYDLAPWDILLIPEHQIHRSILRSTEIYERIIIWINDRFFDKYAEPALREVFRGPLKRGSGLYCPPKQLRAQLTEKLYGVEHHQHAQEPGSRLLSDTYLIQFLLELSSRFVSQPAENEARARSDPRFSALLAYINQNLAGELSIAALAGQFYLSPSHLMHAFKRHTGMTVHQYIQQKRLISAAARIRAGESVTAAAMQAGFMDYTTFLKAFRKQYGCAPGEFRKKIQNN